VTDDAPATPGRAARLSLGELPPLWTLLPGRACLVPKLVRNTGLAEQTVLSLSYGRIVVKPPDKLHGLVPESFETYQIVEVGDLVVRPTDLQNDWTSLRTAISESRGIITSAYLTLRTTDKLLPRFAHYLLRGYDLMKTFYGLGSGLRQNLSWEDFKYLPCCVPPLTEQAVIVRFLDDAHRRVDRAIAAKRRLISLLEEERRGIIEKLVRQGDSDFRMNLASGVPWIGDIPEHWGLARLRVLTTRVTSGSRGWSEYAADSGPVFIRVGNLTRNSIDLDLDEAVRLSLPASAAGEAQRTRVQPNDLLLSITAYIGSVAVVPDAIGEAYISQHVALCRLRPGAANPRWVGYVLMSSIGQTHGVLCMYGGTKQGLSLDDVKDYPVLLPPGEEQDRIVGILDSTLASLAATAHAAIREMELLREYRARLIVDAVTGQLDVPTAAARLRDEPIDGLEVPADIEEGDTSSESSFREDVA
jgi:type I restriction enzyme S subunit